MRGEENWVPEYWIHSFSPPLLYASFSDLFPFVNPEGDGERVVLTSNRDRKWASSSSVI